MNSRPNAATIALTALTLAVALGFSRLFSGNGYLLPVVLAALTGHAVAWWCRRNDLPTSVSAIATLGAVALIGTWTVLGHTTAYGLPLPLTLREAAALLGDARGQFSVVRAPAPVLPGFVLATVIALGVSAFMADWAAFRLQATFEAVIPAFSLFLFTAALGTAHYRTLAVAMFVAAALAFLVSHGLGRSYRGGSWFGGRPAHGPASIARNAAALGAIALVGGLVFGPRIPTATSGELLRYKNRPLAGPSNRATISPLVSIRSRLVERQGLEVFTVEAPVKAYWRLTSLDTFDGTIWSSNDTYRPTRGRINTDEPLRPDIPTAPNAQQFQIAALDSIWLPAAFRPQRVEGLDQVSYNRDTASLITPEATTDGSAYTVQSAVPQLTPELLSTAGTGPVPEDIAARYLTLPTLDARVRNEALRITAAATTPYAKAKALQDYFHRGFRYDLNAKQGHDSRALENFLFRTKAGYCEQFAGSYAVLARLAGLPTRVTVGFTPGELQSDGLYHVRDEHAHAWPEVYLQGFGWVAFEPTPGRGAPNNTVYTGLPEAQDESGNQAALATTTTVAPVAGGDQTTTTLVEPNPNAGAGANKTADKGLPAVVVFFLWLLGLAAVWCVALPVAHVWRRRRRWLAGGGTPAAGVLAAWGDVEETLDRAGVRRRPQETMLEYSVRAAPSAGLIAETKVALQQVADGAAFAAYAEAGVDDTDVADAVHDAKVVRIAVLDQLTWWNRTRWWIDPRALRR
jgi:transglutaminase-like putative cysteine protease